jgi:hypothetical protein
VYKNNGVGFDSELIAKLTPEWYIDELHQFPEIKYKGETHYAEKKNGGAIAFYKGLYICPLCMKENYHSYYHNVVGVQNCFIHDVPLIKQDCLYNISCIKNDPKENKTFNNAFFGILPTERTVDNNVYLNNNIRFRFDKIYPVLIQRQNETNPSMWHLLSGDKEPDRIIQIPKCDDSGEVYCERFVKEYECYHLEYSVWDTNPHDTVSYIGSRAPCGRNCLCWQLHICQHYGRKAVRATAIPYVLQTIRYMA